MAHHAAGGLGEWISSSDCPACDLSETAAPKRMGAAMTYTWHYALFALMGIAGEDDLDAPRVCCRTPAIAAADMLWFLLRFDLGSDRENARTTLILRH
jgi:hypothetical protein